MQIVTICSHNPTQPYYFFNSFLKSCRKYGHEPIILTQGYAGLGTKPGMLQRAIEAGKVTHPYMIFSDAWDVVFQSDPREQEQYLSDALVFNAEKNCFPDPRLADKFPESKTPYRYLNSGFSIGPTDLYLQALREMKATEIQPDHWENGKRIEPNDQLFFQKQYLYGNIPIRLDTFCQYCQTLSDVSEDELLFDNGVIRNRETGSTPIAIHANGGRKEFWKPKLLSYLNL